MPSGGFYDDGKRQFRVFICEEWDCHTSWAKERGVDCKGEFWNKESNCLFYSDHLESNLGIFSKRIYTLKERLYYKLRHYYDQFKWIWRSVR